MERLGEETGESVHLSVTRGDTVVQVAQVDSRYLLGTRDWTEVVVPNHTSALGKVFYAWGALPVPAAALERLTEATITDPARLERDGARARERGWAITHDELEVGLSGVAVPVRGPHGEVVAAVTPAEVHPDDVVALMAGSTVESIARRQLHQLRRLIDELAEVGDLLHWCHPLTDRLRAELAEPDPWYAWNYSREHARAVLAAHPCRPLSG